MTPPSAPQTVVTVCAECLRVLINGEGHDDLCSKG